MVTVWTTTFTTKTLNFAHTDYLRTRCDSHNTSHYFLVQRLIFLIEKHCALWRYKLNIYTKCRLN